LSDNLDPSYLNYDYRLRTPWKFNVSAGTTFEGLVAVGAEYEYQDYGTAKMEDMDGFTLGGESSVRNNLTAVHTLRLGMEARLAPKFSLRAGYNYVSSAFKQGAYRELTSYSTQTEYNNTKDLNTFTFGLGYRGSVIYADMAYKCDMLKSDFYPFDDIDLPATKVDNTRHQLLFTLGAQF
jgi:long-subunit fatty acid transport protein